MPPLLPDEYGAVTKTFCCECGASLLFSCQLCIYHFTALYGDKCYPIRFLFFEEKLDQAAMMTFKHHVSFSLTADSSHKMEKQILLYKITNENVSLTWSRCQISYMDSKVRT